MADESFIVEIVLKACCACGVEKPRSQFHKRAASADGLQPRCVDCVRTYEQERAMRPEIIARGKARRANPLVANKVCIKCHLRLPSSSFYPHRRSSDGLGSTCRKCAAKYNAERNQTPEAKAIAQARDAERSRLFYEVIRAAKDVPCTRCGNCFPSVCMDFHHRDPATKQYGVALMLRCSLDKVRAEIAKCDVLCANCHRIVEFGNGR